MKFAKEIFVILCDDIRQETGNKTSIMGIYSKEITVPDVPFVFPKLCIVIIAKELKVEIGQLKVVLSTPGSKKPIILNFPAPPGQLISKDVHIGIGISPVQIDSEGELKINIFQNNDTKPFASQSVDIIKKENKC